VAAARLAERLAAHAHPLVGGGVGDHVLNELAVSLLVVCDLGELRARRGEPVGHRVADLFELGDTEHAGTAGGGDAPFDPGAREGCAEEAGQLALHAGDLAAQLPARAALVGLGYRGFERRQDFAAAPERDQLLLR